MAKKKKSINTNNLMVILLVITVLVVCGALGFNIYSVLKADSGAGKTDTVQKVGNEYSNDYYTIGNNPTDINKTYFKELNSALKDGDNVKIAESLAKTFVTEYYTWTNKDGNYDIGGIQFASHPCFQNHNVTIFFLKIQKGQSRLNLKGRRMGFSFLRELQADLLQPCHINAQIFFGDHPPVYLDSLPVIKNRGGHITAGHIPRFLENLRDETENRTLSVGSRNVDKFQILLRIAKLLTEITNIG